MAIISNAVTMIDAGAVSASLGSMTLIKTLTASNSANLSFVHGASSVVLDGTYPIYLFKFFDIHPSVDNRDFQVNVSIDSGSNYNVAKTTNYHYNYRGESGTGTGVEYIGGASLHQETGFQEIMENVGGDNDQSGSGEMYLFSPASTTFIKHFIARMTHYSANNYNKHGYMSGYANTTSAVNAVQFKMAADNIQTGTIKLYGIKDS